ncbi:MAG TPA: lipoyl synthase [Clostridiales bacterium]|nr:lipoyl synthase [Clostridiales bacterium]
MKDKRPEWIKVRLKGEHQLREVKEMLSRLSLHTVCEEANCPNIGECFGRRTATFMILGRVCTRNCTFCNVTKGNAQPVDPNEPRHVAEAVKELQLRHVVITSVTRDDLPDGGAAHFAEVIKSIKALDEKVVVEVLIPDFKSSQDALKLVVDAKPEIINHNVETVPRLYPTVRPMAVYQRSLSLLKNVKTMDDSILTKSGIMLGLGEREEEVIDVLKDLRKVGCDIMTIGQYLAPSKKHHPVVEYIRPEVFDRYKDICLELGFKYVASSPLVRSSYHADQALK